MVTMNEKEIKRIKKYVKDRMPDDYDKVDVESKIDRSLSYDENITLLKNALNIKEEITKAKVQSVIDVENYELMKDLQEQEQKAHKEFVESLKVIKQNDNDIIDKSFYTLNHYCKMICEGFATGLIVEGETGLGKSFHILNNLKKSGKEFVYCSGYTTALELYHFLYFNKDKIIFFDDTKNVFGNDVGLELLKSCLYSATGTRFVRYSTTSSKLKVPRQFIFNGGVIISVNQLDKNGEDMKAVIDRVLYQNISFSYQEKMRIIAELVKIPYKNLTLEQRNEVFDFIKDNTSEATENLNFRLLFKLYDIYLYDSIEFKRLGIKAIKVNKHKELVIKVLADSNSIGEAQVKWCEKTGKSRRSFFRVKKEMDIYTKVENI